MPEHSTRTFPDALQPLPQSGMQSLVVGGGCFWCVEGVFLMLKGVQAVESGYSGGRAERANYDAVCTGLSGHAEVVRIDYDADIISFTELLKVFFAVAHDPTQLNRQGNDRGTQYRSVIFYADDQMRSVAELYIAQLNRAGVFDEPIATTLEPLEAFYPAEDYHQNYAARNPGQPYIACIAQPKMAKLYDTFPELLKAQA